jgi:hypothetical protein
MKEQIIINNISTLALTNETTNEPKMNVDQEEEESCWVPLVEETMAQTAREQPQAADEATTPGDSNTNDSPPPNSNLSSRCESLQVISSRLDSKIRLKQGLVDHPLDRAWRLFIQHFLREIWNLEITLQLGIVLVVIGMILLAMTWALSFRWLNFQTVVLLIVFMISFYYLAPPDIEEKFHAMFRLVFNPEKALELADYADPAIMRRLFISLLLIPTFLELRTFGFLSEAMADSGFKSNLSVGIFLGAFLAHEFKVKSATPRQCIQRGIYILYGCALVCSLWRVDLRRLPALAGPFFVATGTLLLSSRDEDMNWLSRVIRHALRLTLRDVLASVGESVREDEMLQLAMLRWLVDFWSSQPISRPQQSSAESHTSTTTAIVTSSNSASRETHTQRPSLQWDELQPMLDMTTDQMTEEVPCHEASGSFSEQPQSQNSMRQDNDSLQNLRNLLHSLNVDDRARPAVLAYKRVVESFPPTRIHSIFLSILRRCPAMLMLLYRYLAGSDLALATTVTLLPFAVMEAFRVLHWAEACQGALASGVRSVAREETANRGSGRTPLIALPIDMDPMCILLSGDHYTPTFPPPLLQVWINICSSVHALEMGLTAARCVQTTAVAADFASNIISLAQFGMEVTQFGWLHGITVLAREIMHIHATQSTGGARYTCAAVNAVRNGQIVARNVQALSEEDAGNPVFDPLVGALTAIVGRGWLWGKEQVDQRTPTVSTVTIEELPSDESPTDIKEWKALKKDTSTENSADNEASMEEKNQNRGDQASTAAGDEGESNVDACSTAHIIIKSQDQEEKTLGGQVDEKSAAPVETVVANDKAWIKDERLELSDSKCHLSQSNSTHDKTENDLSELMDLIANAFEQGLIVESEKNAFMETLLDKPSASAVDQMERTLRELLETLQSEQSSQYQENESPVMHPEEGDAGEPMSTSINMNAQVSVGSTTNHDADDPDEWRPLTSQTEVSDDAVGESPPRNDQTTTSVVPRGTSLFGAPDLQALNGTTMQQRSDESQQEGKNDELFKWIGGGLAVIGAVAGGIAIASSASQREDGNSSRQRNVTNQSTVYIEELDDSEESANEWVDVAESNRDS